MTAETKRAKENGIKEADPHFFHALQRARAFTLIGAGVAGVVIALAAVAVIVGLNNKKAISSIRPKINGGSETCSGGNKKACDRVCQSEAARLVIQDASGNVLTVKCHKSPVTEAAGSPTISAVRVSPSPAGPSGPRGPTGPAARPSPLSPSPPVSPKPQPEPAPTPPSPNPGGTHLINPDGPLGGVCQPTGNLLC